jgi:uncharacterized protein (TIGR03437 family)
MNTVPAGLAILVDGLSYTGGQSVELPANTTHTISLPTPQAGTNGTRYVFNNWSDGGSLSHTINVFTPATYTATFNAQFRLTLSVAPPWTGQVTPASGGFYDAGASVTLAATPNTGYMFQSWTGANPPSSATATVVMSGPLSVTANFQPNGHAPQIGTVLNSGSFQQAQAAPNTVLSLFGTNLSCVPAPQVLVNGVAAQVLFSSGTQINFVIPAGLGRAGNASVTVGCNGVISRAGTLALSPADPSIFSLTQNGCRAGGASLGTIRYEPQLLSDGDAGLQLELLTGQGAVLNLDYTVNGAQSPATLGSYIFVYVTGFGDLNPAGSDGLQHLTLPVTASIGAVPAQVTYAGEAPGYSSGMQQVNILIPENAPVGLAVPIQIMVSGVNTQSGVTIAIQ